MRSKGIFALNLALIAAAIIASVALWGMLPEQVPIHFNLSGEPDRWVERSFFSWYVLPLVALGVVVFFLALIRLATRNPKLWNVPNPKLWLALSPEQREPVVEIFRRFMGWTSLRVSIIMIIVQAAVYLTAVRAIRGITWYTGFLVLALTVYTVVQAFRLQKVLERAIEDAGRGTEVAG